MNFEDAIKKISETRISINSNMVDINPLLLEFLDNNSGLDLSLDIDDPISSIIEELNSTIDKIFAGLYETIKRTSEEAIKFIDNLVKQVQKLEKNINNIVNNFFRNISDTILNIQANFVDPILEGIQNLQENFFRSINEVLDKIFNYIEGSKQEFRLRMRGLLELPINFLDPCRRELNLEIEPFGGFADTQLFNLFECRQLRRLQDNPKVKDFKDVYLDIQREIFRMTCYSRENFDDFNNYLDKWLNYRRKYAIWNQYEDNMTPEEAYESALSNLKQAREEYQAKTSEINGIKEKFKNYLTNAKFNAFIGEAHKDKKNIFNSYTTTKSFNEYKKEREKLLKFKPHGNAELAAQGVTLSRLKMGNKGSFYIVFDSNGIITACNKNSCKTVFKWPD